MKADPPLYRKLGRLQEPLNVFEEDSNLFIVLRNLAGQLFVGAKNLPQPYKRAHDRYVDIGRAIAV
jgi:hypothetical protein